MKLQARFAFSRLHSDWISVNHNTSHCCATQRRGTIIDWAFFSSLENQSFENQIDIANSADRISMLCLAKWNILFSLSYKKTHSPSVVIIFKNITYAPKTLNVCFWPDFQVMDLSEFQKTSISDVFRSLRIYCSCPGGWSGKIYTLYIHTVNTFLNKEKK